MDAEIRKQRIHRLIDLARITHGWSMPQLASALGRPGSDVYPETDSPGMPFFSRLAAALEWRVGDVIEVIWGDPGMPSATSHEGVTEVRWSELYDQWVEAHREGQRNQELVRIARDMRLIADTPPRRALTCALEGIGWDALGRYVEAVDIFRQGLQITPLPPTLRRNLQGNLASAMYSLWDLFPALAMADTLIRWYDVNPPTDAPDRKRQAFIRYVRGNTHRRMMRHHPEQANEHASRAMEDLRVAADLHTRLAAELDEERFGGIAHTCEGGLLEVEVQLGRRTPDDALAIYHERLSSIRSLQEYNGDWIESFGWWAIFACNVARQHLTGRALGDAVQIFAARALECADIRDNWSLRERAFSAQYGETEGVEQCDIVTRNGAIDDVDQALIAAMISRFPSFRSVGWKILDNAHVVHNQ